MKCFYGTFVQGATKTKTKSMTSIVFIIFMFFFISSFIAPLFYGDKVNRYILKNKGKLIRTEFKRYSYPRRNTINKEVIIKYKDQYNNSREVSLHYIGLFSYFGEDKITDYSTTSPEYAELKREQINFETIAIEFNEVDYKLENQEVLTIKQEYPNPNIGEFAYINNKPAPNGRYKIGFLHSVYVVDGKIAKELPEIEIETPIKEKPEIIKPKYTNFTYNCNEGELLIEQEFHNPNSGELAYLNGKPALSGKYKVSFFHSITILDGKVNN
jgi:hypothetical protein